MGFLEEYFGWILGIITVALIMLVIAAGMSSAAKHNRLMAQCIADGKKEYECEAMLKTDTDFVAVPVIIPVSR